jgi:hypothetical protein
MRTGSMVIFLTSEEVVWVEKGVRRFRLWEKEVVVGGSDTDAEGN